MSVHVCTYTNTSTHTHVSKIVYTETQNFVQIFKSLLKKMAAAKCLQTLELRLSTAPGREISAKYNPQINEMTTDPQEGSIPLIEAPSA